VEKAAASAELRRDRADTEGGEVRTNLRAAWWRGDARFAMASDLRCEERGEARVSNRTYEREIGGREIQFTQEQDLCRTELGLTAEKPLSGALLLEVLTVLNHADKSILSTEAAVRQPTGLTEYHVSDTTENSSSEAIVRLELTSIGLQDHVVLSSFELSANRMRNSLERTLEAEGGVSTAPVPGANGTVGELRASAYVGDTWMNDGFTVDFGIGAETSRLTQEGHAESERTFAYLKPAAGFTFALDGGTRWGIRLAKEVSQLEFNNFVTEANLQDGVIAPGNPHLRPEVHWLAEVSLTRGFAGSGALDITGFHNWISDVEDQLPVGAMSTATGNIGRGTRWGIDFGATLPLDGIGLDGARLDIAGRWQDSSVVDPATGRERVLSDEREYNVTIEYRHDVEATNVAWGGRVRMLAARPLFKVNETDVHDESNDVQLFLETTRWRDMKLRMTVDDVFNRGQTRERRVYAGERLLAPLLFHESRLRRGGRRISLALSGAF
jgi:hypothetical protein